MQRSKRRAALGVTADRFDLDNPFLAWFAAYHGRGAGRCVPYRKPGEAAVSGCDLIMGELASRRFSIGVEGGVPWLGVDEHDLGAVTALRWSSAAFLRRVQGQDWIALSAKDARVEDARSERPVPLRLWLPVRSGLLDGFLDSPRPEELRLVEAVRRGGRPEAKSGEAIAGLPLSFKGVWQPDPAPAAG